MDASPCPDASAREHADAARARRASALPWAVSVAAALWFALALPGRDLWTTGEHRYAEVARNLVAPGADGIVPHLNGAVYADKPPGWFWLAGALHRWAGLDLADAARIPSVLGAALSVGVVAWLAQRWWGARAALAAAGTLATTHLFGWSARTAQLDGLLCGTITLSIAAGVRAIETPPRERAARSAWTALASIAVAAGILVKGPPAVLFPVLVLGGWLAWTQPRRLRTPSLAWAAALALLPGAVWLADAYAHAGERYVRDLLVGHAVGHAAGMVDKQEPWHFYLWTMPEALLPWTLLLPAAALPALRRRSATATDRLLLVWLAVPVIVFSLSPAKRDLYLLPILPAAALLLARLVRAAQEDPRRLMAPLVRAPVRALALVAGGAGAAIVAAGAAALAAGPGAFGIARLADSAWFGARWSWERISLAIALGAAMALAGRAAFRARTLGAAAAGLVAGFLAFETLLAGVVAPARDPDMSARAFLGEVRGRLGGAPLARLGGDGGLQYAANWVLGRDCVPELRDEAAAERFLAADAPRLVVTDAAELRRRGRPRGAVVLVEKRRRRSPDLYLLGNAAAAR